LDQLRVVSGSASHRAGDEDEERGHAPSLSVGHFRASSGFVRRSPGATGSEPASKRLQPARRDRRERFMNTVLGLYPSGQLAALWAVLSDLRAEPHESGLASRRRGGTSTPQLSCLQTRCELVAATSGRSALQAELGVSRVGRGDEGVAIGGVAALMLSARA